MHSKYYNKLLHINISISLIYTRLLNKIINKILRSNNNVFVMKNYLLKLYVDNLNIYIYNSNNNNKLKNSN